MPMIRRAVPLLIALLLPMAPARAADAPPTTKPPVAAPTALWARDPGFRELRLSPDGRHLAARIHDADGAGVVVLTLPELKPVGGVKLERDEAIVDFVWSGNEYLVAELGTYVGPIEQSVATGELISFRHDGAELMYVLGHKRAGGRNHSAVLGTLVDPLHDDPLHVLVVTQRYDKARSEQTLQKLNIRTSKLTELAVAPGHGHARFVRDAAGEVRYVTVDRDDAVFVRDIWQREADGGWTPWQDEGAGIDAQPIALSRDGTQLYRHVSRNRGPWCLDRVELASGKVESLACHDRAEVLDLVHAFDGSREPIAAVLEPGRSETRVFASGHPHRELLQLAIGAFPGKRVSVVSASHGGRHVLLQVDDDRSPGDWYLFDTVTRKIDYLLARQEWLDPAWMGERRPLSIKARDGATLQAYLTLPPGQGDKDLPLVVWPHGGPFQIRDHWAFDQDPQFLATHGYAVLQVNFRGSGGHGPAFVTAGKRAWGTTMIDDLTDAVRATIASGVVDGSRVCIGGWSYGGYAALMSAVREPDLYRCAIGAAGVYDLARQIRDSDTGDSWQGRRYYADAVAPDEASQRAASPLDRIAALKAPVLIVHGGEDRRVPLSQAKLLRAALEKQQHPHETLIIDEEGHGFGRPQNVQRYYDTLLAFLARHLVPAAAPAANAPD